MRGEILVKYTNGKYLTAPYDLIITSVNLPETKMDSVYIGKTVKVKVPALNDKEIEGIITDITSTATNGRFTATIEFDNDGSIKLGMTVNIYVNYNGGNQAGTITCGISGDATASGNANITARQNNATATISLTLTSPLPKESSYTISCTHSSGDNAGKAKINGFEFIINP